LARRRKASSSESAVGIAALFVFGLIGIVLAAVIAVLQSPFFWITAILVGLVFIAFKTKEHYWNKIFPDRYFAGEEFLDLKARISEYVDECNQLNDHIGELKASQESIRSSSKDIGALRDTSQYNFARRAWDERLSGTQVHNCSKIIVSNAQNDPFKYLCKYFSIKTNEKSLSSFEGMLNDFSAAEDGAECLTEKRQELISSIIEEVHPQIKIRHWERLSWELGFEEFVFDQLSFPVYSFQYVSAGGNSSMTYDIEMDTDALEEFVDYLSEKVKFRKSVAGQRALMTKALRNSIKERDDLTCQKCGISAHDTQNLLLEIDHIKPLSKGGITSEENLQTLCWKCNRSKGSSDPT